MSETNYSSSYKRTNFYKQIEKKSLTPLWEVMQDLVLPKPSSPCIPKIWKYDDIRKDILEAGDIVFKANVDSLDKNYIDKNLDNLVKDTDLSKFIL